MKTITVQIAHTAQKYNVHVGVDLLGQIDTLFDMKKHTSAYIITDSHVAPHYLAAVTASLAHVFARNRIHSFVFEAGEKNKQLATVEKIYQDMAEKQLDRKALVVNLGGGVVTDMGGFAAATYQRGIDCINISTTLEGMVDASVGGKTGVNLGDLKNYVGLFIQPKIVIADVSTLATVPARVLREGYAEVLKHGLIADADYFQMAGSIDPVKATAHQLVDIITRSIEIKAQIVQADEQENGARKLLNFGHTVGHVLESLSFETDEPLFHGEAIAIGMIAEAKIAEATGMICEDAFVQIEQAIATAGLPTRYTPHISVGAVMSRLQTDKKSIGRKVKWTLLSAIGTGEFNIEVDNRFVKEAVTYIFK